jgi:hypothetical protein
MKMANIIITSYTKDRKEAKKSVRYMTHRCGKEKQKATRQIFGIDGALEKHHAYQMIDGSQKGTVFFRIVISPDPKKEDTRRDLYLWQITEHTMLKLEERLQKQIDYAAVEHNDHTDIRHVHLLACVKARIDKPDLKSLREAATEACLLQRRECDLAREAKVREIEEAQWEI